MKAALYDSPKPSPPYLTLTSLSSPVPTAGSIVVKVLASPVLPYAEEIFRGERIYPNLLPYVPGGGAVGVVTAVGPDVANPLLQPGTGHLVYCDLTIRARDDPRSPAIMLQGISAPDARAQQVQAVFRHGSWAEEMLVPAENVFVIPPSITLDPATLAALGSVLVPFGGLCDGDICAGATVVITGATGHFGSAAVAAALALGARKVIPCGRSERGVAKLIEVFGAQRLAPVVLSGDAEKDKKAIISAAGTGFEIDVHFDMLHPLAPPSLVATVMSTLRRGGTSILMGGLTTDVPLPYREVLFKGIVVKGVWMYERRLIPKLLGLVEGGLVDLKMFDVETYKLDDANEAVVAAAKRNGACQTTVIVCNQV
ncbi:alcohol dehydrogenase zinc-binding domain protein [Gloeophyllum trabeum ATCC 11539]|uniref:Alcohol dehydrogenase zinc-binding domain protein n=1 Tax=Gloeophyllum trabeum (strain ATCC 11539 / FP-39264 / Madison 617) TaxID=670483 RepID=S7PYI7_GLOTA|nr:alcohol dehydrogenase zinc-binding domain protein [Gloeophyllum trabeum ATCC 11539]EPQ52716.1 alcohol dehydrogenase zinc-binding domain protein [Gloeophyllum trabeum ATCC 11539]